MWWGITWYNCITTPFLRKSQIQHTKSNPHELSAPHSLWPCPAQMDLRWPFRGASDRPMKTTHISSERSTTIKKHYWVFWLFNFEYWIVKPLNHWTILFKYYSTPLNKNIETIWRTKRFQQNKTLRVSASLKPGRHVRAVWREPFADFCPSFVDIGLVDCSSMIIWNVFLCA